MSLYNLLFGENDQADMLLACLNLTKDQVPRYRDCGIEDNCIYIYTRTGGGNRDFYENEKTCRDNYPDYFNGQPDQFPQGPWNDDLRAHLNYVSDQDNDFDSTYATFYFSFPQEYRNDLIALAKQNQNHTPSEKWKILFENLKDKK